MDSEFEKSDLRDRVIRPAAEMEKSNTPARHRPRGNALGCVALQVGVHPSVALSQWEVATLPAQTMGFTFSQGHDRRLAVPVVGNCFERALILS